jgi:8-oxo-dGTP diphosphatase
MTSRIHVVIGVLKDSANNILLSLRPKHKHLGNHWEFPGGKLEARETPLAALKREYFEEVGVEVKAAEPLMQFPYDYPHKQVFLDFWLITDFSGTPHGKEGQTVRWVPIQTLPDYRLPEANQPVIDLLIKN